MREICEQVSASLCAEFEREVIQMSEAQGWCWIPATFQQSVSYETCIGAYNAELMVWHIGFSSQHMGWSPFVFVAGLKPQIRQNILKRKSTYRVLGVTCWNTGCVEDCGGQRLKRRDICSTKPSMLNPLFGSNLIGGLEYFFPYSGNFIIPTDELIFFKMVKTTNQATMLDSSAHSIQIYYWDDPDLSHCDTCLDDPIENTGYWWLPLWK